MLYDAIVLVVYSLCSMFSLMYVEFLKRCPPKRSDSATKSVTDKLRKDRTLSPIPNGNEKMATANKRKHVRAFCNQKGGHEKIFVNVFARSRKAI